MSSKAKITVSEIARKAGVSPATVSRVINHRNIVKESTILQVEEAMRSLGISLQEYIPRVPDIQPVIIINVPDLSNSFYTEVIQGAMSSAKSHGCHLLIGESPLDHGSVNDFCDLITRVNAAGVILLNKASVDILERLERIVPVMQCCEFNPDSPLPYVSIDDRTAAKNAVEYLISCGRNKIAFINGPLSFKYATERRLGYLDGLEQADISIPQNWMIHLPEVNYDMAFSATCQLLSADVVPNAFFTISDTLATAVIRAAKRYHYKVPDDIMVVGFDNISLSSMVIPSITTINQPKFQEGFTACEMLLERISMPSLPTRSILFDTELIVRESTSV